MTGASATAAASASVGSAATASGCSIVSAAIAAAVIEALLTAGTVGACVAALAVVAKPIVSAAITAVSVTTYGLAVVRAGAGLGRGLVSAAGCLVSAAEVRLLRWTRCAAAGIAAVPNTLIAAALIAERGLVAVLVKLWYAIRSNGGYCQS